MASRVLKVCAVFPYTNQHGRFVKVPSIKLQGRWLEALGFTTDRMVEVMESVGEITLKIIQGK